MSDPITDAVAHLQGLAGGLSGMRAAPAVPPNDIKLYPFSVTSCAHAPIIGGDPPGQISGQVEFLTQIHVQKKDYPRDFLAVMPYAWLMAKAIWGESPAPTLGGKVIAVLLVDCMFGHSEYGAVQTFCWNIRTVCEMKANLP